MVQTVAPHPVACKLGVGCNIFWPFGGPLVVDAFDPQTAYRPASEVFGPLANGPWERHVTPAVYRQLLDAGLDHIRIQLNPGPWLQAIGSGAAAEHAALDALLDRAVDDTVAAGLIVVLSCIFTGYARDPVASVLQGIGDGAYQAYRTLMVRWCSRLGSRIAPSSLAFETLNEPPARSDFPADWPELQHDLYTSMRKAAPRHTLVCTGENYGSIDSPDGGLVDLDASRYDGNVIWSFHPLIPAPASMQGYPFNLYRYVQSLAYPPRPSHKPGAIADMEARVQADIAVDPSARAAVVAKLTLELEAYFGLPQDGRWICQQFGQAVAWAKRQGLPASALYAGEWGGVRTNAGIADSLPGYTGMDSRDRVSLYRDVSVAIRNHGVRSCYDHLDTFDYGVTLASGAAIGAFDPELIAAIDPKGLRSALGERI